MNDVLADTHAIVWFLFDPPKLSAVADATLTKASQSGTILVSAITLVEVSYLSTKKSFPYTGVLSRRVSLARNPIEPLKVLPLTLDVAVMMDRIPRSEIPDMPDRIVAATAVANTLPLVSVDSDIQSSPSLKALIRVIWN
jgi:PIN domain nuclease of toxin-antitoxin system